MMKHKWVAVLMGVVILPGLVGCGPRVALSPGDPGTIIPPQTPATLSPVVGLTPFRDESSASVEYARQDLAQRLGVSVDTVTVAAVIGQEYSTDAFYCRATKDRIAKDDPPAVIAGFTILLHVSGRRYEYHASGPNVLFCRPLP